MTIIPRVEQVIPGDRNLDDLTERDGTAWLRARPELLGLCAHIVWLFAPVSQNRPWPGDLVGLDRNGNLILVESKYVGRGSSRCDPFRTFAGYDEDDRWRESRTPAALRREWETRYAQELARKSKFDTSSFSDTEPMPGVLPYGNHRAMWQRWPELYSEVDAHLFEDDAEWGFSYRAKVERHLHVREARMNTFVIYAGFVLVTTEEPPDALREGSLKRAEDATDVLSESGLEHLARVQGTQSEPRVMLRVARARRQGAVVRVVSRAVEV